MGSQGVGLYELRLVKRATVKSFPQALTDLMGSFIGVTKEQSTESAASLCVCVYLCVFMCRSKEPLT